MSLETASATAPVLPVKKKERSFIKTWKRLIKNKVALVGIIIIAIQVVLAIFAPAFVSHSPVKQNLALAELPPGAEGYWLGTDNFGRDMWSRLVY
ncbi:MAG TPA: diguanylate cyclase, partial [Bacillus bacterium]|nr:diguanylate cyclase [Bacillus sp. (in: firmicutes)]